MKRSVMVLSMMVILTACTSKFDGFDPTTATVRWIIKQNFSIEKDELQVKKNCQALNTSGGYISGFLKHTLSIRAFGDPLVRARKAGV